MIITKKAVDKVTHKNAVGRVFSICLSFLIIAIFLAVIGFVIYSAIPAFQANGNFGFKEIFLTTDFNLNKNQASIWMPLAISLLITFGALLIAVPVGIKTATFMKFRLSHKWYKKSKLIVQTLAGIPSVVFGVFALNSLGQVISAIFGLESVYNVLNTIFMIAFMILPTIIALTISTYDGIDKKLLLNPIALGLNKTNGIYKIFKKQAIPGIIVAVIVATGRAIGETMAISMILNSDSFAGLTGGLFETLRSSLGNIGWVIANNMFTESTDPGLKGVLYVFGIFLFVIVLILNAIVLAITNSKNKNPTFKKVELYLHRIVMFIPNSLLHLVGSHIYNHKHNINVNDNVKTSTFIKHRFKNNNFINWRTYWWIGLEIFCAFITFGFLAWIIGDVLINGIIAIFGTDASLYSTAFIYTKNTTGQAFINTILIILSSLIISLPIALFVAIYLNEYSKNKKFKKIILFFIDCLGASPSIIFGMFGLAVFIELLGISSNGSIGRSLLAGALTISIVILPVLIRTIYQALIGVPDIVRHNALSLGMSQLQTTFKVVIPQAYKAIMTATILATSRIIAETAPLFLTSGLTSASQINLLNPGQTLTTRIYAEIVASQDLNATNSITYECAFISLVIIILLIWISNVLIPNYQEYKMLAKFYWMYYFKTGEFKRIDPSLFTKQTIKKTIYISYDQAYENKYDMEKIKFIFNDKKIYRVKFLKNTDISRLMRNN